MKNIITFVRNYFLTPFMVFYLFVILVPHAWRELSLLLIVGLILAAVFHSKKIDQLLGRWPLMQKAKRIMNPLFLVLHMATEWVFWIQTPVVWGWIFRSGHAASDVVFYKHEVRSSRRKNLWLAGGAIFVLLFVFIVTTYAEQSTQHQGFMPMDHASCNHASDSDWLESLHQFSLGGAVGCVSSHLSHKARGLAGKFLQRLHLQDA